MGPDGVISPHLLGNGLIMSIWRRLGMGSSPYSPVIPLVICLPLRPLTGALMALRRSEAFWSWIRLLSRTQSSHPSSILIFFFSFSVAHSKTPQAVFIYVTPDLRETRLGFLGHHSNDLQNPLGFSHGDST